MSLINDNNITVKYSPIVLKLLEKRGISGADQVEEYLSPKPRLTYDPMLMKNMDEVSDIIIRYAAEGRRICVYGDYDADGVTSVTLMMSMLGMLGADAFYHIPSRFKEGYGLNMGAIDEIAARGTELIVTVDCGCTSVKEIQHIKELGMEVIVTDHHNLGEELPDCLMLNPKQADDSYPFAYLCGCGVAFKLAQAVGRKANLPKTWLNSLLDITGVATVGDIVPLRDENRTLVKYGMDRIKKQQRPGLKGLMAEASIDAGKLNSTSIAFGIVPHINSGGRLRTADIGVKLLSSEDPDEIRELSAEMAALNNERKSIQDRVFKTAVSYIDQNLADDLFILYEAGDAHEGITGIVAGKLRESYGKPAVIVTDTENPDIVKGTGRSLPGVDLHALLSKYKEVFVKFGGHAGACGFSMYRDKVAELRDNLNRDLRDMLVEKPDLLDTALVTDETITGDDVSLDLAMQLSLMEPFGAENPKPLFRITGCSVKGIRTMGARGQFLKINLVSEHGNTFEAVSFDEDANRELSLSVGDLLEMVGELDINTFRGKSSVQVIIRSFQ